MTNNSNCNSLSRFGPLSEGIPLNAVMGKGLGVSTGHPHIARDQYYGCDVDTTGPEPVVYRAMIHEYGGNGFPRIKTLRKPINLSPKTMLIKAFLGMPHGAPVRIQEKEIFFFTAVVGIDTIIEYGQEVFVEIKDEQEVSFLFIDGHVRTFRNFSGVLCEIAHTPETMLKVRIQDALSRIARAREKEAGEDRMRQVRGVLHGMTDMLYFTTCFEEGHEMRTSLIHNFFHGITFPEFALIRGRLWDLMSDFDKSLLPTLSENAFSNAYSDLADAKVVRINASVPPRGAVLSLVNSGGSAELPHIFGDEKSIEKK